jgi:Flp pilus assembly CpaF family ATPase
VTGEPQLRVLEADLRRSVVDALAEFVRETEAAGHPTPSEADRRVRARGVLRQEIDAHIRAAQQRGEEVLSAEDEQALIERVVGSVFSPLPGAEPYLARADVTNIMAIGNDPVQLRLISGERVVAEPMVESDGDLIDLLQMAARRAGHAEKEFSETRPVLELQLRDGSRLAASAWITPRPYLSIRRHPLMRAHHSDLVALGEYDQGIETLLRAFVRARWNGMICGATDAGKTTLLRAMLEDVDGDEWPVTLESDPELRMDERPGPVRWRAFYERGPNAEGQGELTLAELSLRLKRHHPTRVIVGEVRGPEVITMLEAMTSGQRGSWCTMHADSPAGVFPRLFVYSARAEGHWDREHVYSLGALALDVVIFLDNAADGRKVIAGIRHVESYDPFTGQVVYGDWFVPAPDGAAMPNPESPIPVELLDELVVHGYDPGLHRHARVVLR